MSYVALGRSTGPVWLRNAPLALCYVAFPLSNQLAEAVGKPLYRNWIDIAWVMLVISVLALMPRGHANRSEPAPRLMAAAVSMVAIALALAGVVSGQAPMVTAAMELKPVFYALVAIVVLNRVAAPASEDFCRYGAVLATLLIMEALARSFASAAVERPIGSGEVNYDAALLCVSLVFATAARPLARRYGWIIWAGILASFSRTSLLAACLILLFSSVIPMRLRLVMCCLAIGAALASFAIRDLEIGSLESLDRYWMWVSGLNYLSSNLMTSALAAAPGSAVDSDVPKYIADLWTDQQENLNLDGIYPFHFHAMWLRLAIGWGWLPVAVGAVIFYRSYFSDRRRASEARPFFAACVVLGLTMGLLYLGNVATVVLLAGYRALARRRPLPRRRKAPLLSAHSRPPKALLQGTGLAPVIPVQQ